MPRKRVTEEAECPGCGRSYLVLYDRCPWCIREANQALLRSYVTTLSAGEPE